MLIKKSVFLKYIFQFQFLDLPELGGVKQGRCFDLRLVPKMIMTEFLFYN